MMRRFASANARAVVPAARAVRTTPVALAGTAAVVPSFACPLASKQPQPHSGRFLHNHNHRANPCEPSCVETAVDGSLVFYFEADSEGMTGYRSVASQVSEGHLPGSVENAQVSGFATWKVPRDEYAKVVASHMPFLL